MQLNWPKTAGRKLFLVSVLMPETEVLETLLNYDQNRGEDTKAMDAWSLVWHRVKLAAAYMMLGRTGFIISPMFLKHIR